jgi:hypothetical protein
MGCFRQKIKAEFSRTTAIFFRNQSTIRIKIRQNSPIFQILTQKSCKGPFFTVIVLKSLNRSLKDFYINFSKLGPSSILKKLIVVLFNFYAMLKRGLKISDTFEKP